MGRRVLLLAGFVACTSSDWPGPLPGDSGVDSSADACWAFDCFDASMPDAGNQLPPWPPEASVPPPFEDCSDGAACVLPPSVCATWYALEYYDNGVCVDGGCQFSVAYYECQCVDGGCVNSSTAPITR